MIEIKMKKKNEQRRREGWRSGALQERSVGREFSSLMFMHLTKREGSRGITLPRDIAVSMDFFEGSHILMMTLGMLWHLGLPPVRGRLLKINPFLISNRISPGP